MASIYFRDASIRNWEVFGWPCQAVSLRDLTTEDCRFPKIPSGSIVVVHISDLTIENRAQFDADELYSGSLVVAVTGNVKNIQSFGKGNANRFFRYPRNVTKNNDKLKQDPVVKGLRKLCEYARDYPNKPVSDWGEFFPLTHLVEPLSNIIHDVGNRFAPLRIHVEYLRRPGANLAEVCERALGNDGYLVLERSLGGSSKTLADFVRSIPQRVNEEPDLAKLASPATSSGSPNTLCIEEHCESFPPKLQSAKDLVKIAQDEGRLPQTSDLVGVLEDILSWANDLDRCLRHLRHLAEGS